MLNTAQCTHSLVVLPYEHRFIWCVTGSAVFLVGQERLELAENGVLYISSAQPYQCICCSDDFSAVYYYFDLTTQNKGYHVRNKPMPAVCFEEQRVICRYRLQQNGQPLNYLAVQNAYDTAKYSNKILEHAYPAVVDTLQESLLSGYAILALTHLLKCQNKTEMLDLDSIARAVRFHKSYVNRAMREYAGLSVHRYLLRYRLEKAMQLLSTTAVTVGEVAEQCGFRDSKHFATAFKQYYGVSPSKISVRDPL